MLKVRPMDKDEFADFVSNGEPTALEYFKANVSEGFDNSTLGLAVDKVREGLAAGNDRKSLEGRSARTGIPVSRPQTDPDLKVFSKQEWEQSPFYREGVEFKDGWSEGRAKYLAESFDERQLRTMTLEKGGEGAGRTIMGFAGQMVGGLPDPVNLIPFGSGVKGTSLTVKALRGMTEGAAGNLAVSSLSRPYWERRGVDSDFQDYVNDIFIGGMMGGGFSMAGHGVSKLRERRSNARLKDRQVVAEAADKAVEAFNAADELNLSDKVQSLNEAYNSIYDIEGVKHSDRLVLAEEQLIGMGMEPEVARESMAPMVAHVQMIADATGKSFDEAWGEFGAGFQAAEIRGEKITPVSPESRRVESLVDSELKMMSQEIDEAQPGKRLFEDGQFVGSQESTFPQWYRDAGIKNKEHLNKVLQSKKGPVYERLVKIAEDRLENGYESRTHGRVGPVEEFTQLRQAMEAPVGQESNPLFKRSNTTERGAIQFRKDGQAIISLFRDADRSTILHESGHLFLNNLERLQEIPAFKKDLGTIRDWLGLKHGEKIGVEHHEKFARGFEQYLREGRAPRRALEGVFERFKDWLTSIYKSARNLDVELSDGAREVYAHLLGGSPDFSPVKAPEAPAPRITPEQAVVEIQGTELEAMVQSTPGIATPDEVRALRQSIDEIDAETRALDEVAQFFQGARDDKALMEAANKVGISKTQFERIIDEFNSRLQMEDEARLGIEKLIEEKRQALAAEARELKRQAYLSLSARTEVIAHTDKIIKAGGSPRQALLSLLEGDSALRGVEGAGKSVDGHYVALAQSTSARCFSELRKIAPNIEKLFENDIQFNQNVLKEMVTPGSSGDEMAAQAGKVFKQFADEVRERANLAGAKIGKLDEWTPRTHDLDKMIGKRNEWISFMMENLDPDRTFVGMNEGGKREALEEIFASLITDNHGDKMEIPLDSPVARPPRNISKKMGEHRSLHFKSAEAELQYLKKFGQGDNILQSMSRHLESMSRSIALMERLGPNPESTVTHALQKLHDDIKSQLKDGKITDAQADEMLKEMGDAGALKSRDSDIGHALGMALGENDSAQGMFKTFARTMRAINSLSKLGAALLSQPTDFVHAVNERRITTKNNVAQAWVETFQDYFSRATPEMKEVLEHTGIFVDAMNVQNFNRFEADNINSRLSRWNDKMFRYSGQDWHVRNSKKAAALSLTRELGENIGKAWKDVHPGLKEALAQYGSFNEQKWDMLRKTDPVTLDGKAYYHPGLIEKLDDSAFEEMIPDEFKVSGRELPLEGEAPKTDKAWEEGRAREIKRARQKLEMDLKTFFVEEGRNAAPEPDARVRRIMSFGSKQGTKTYEAIKLLTQFKTFAFVNYDRAIRGKRMMVDPKDYGGLAHHAVATLALGYLSTVLKDLSKGLQPADPSEGKTWGRAVFQSGGLGIMGDFVQAGISSRSGADALTSLMGPTFSTVSNFVNLSGKTIRGDVLEDPSKLTSDWVNFGRSLAPAPLSSLWYTRAAMDLVIWSQLKETLEPGSIRRSERRLKKEYNQEYIVSPRAIGR